METKRLFDVIAVRLDDHSERVMERGLPEREAEVYIEMAVCRRGVDEEFFTKRPHVATPEPPR